MKKMSKSAKTVTLMGAMLGVSGLTHAQIAQDLEKPGLYASIQAAVVSDDNVLRQATAEKSDTITIVAPDLGYAVFFGKHRLVAQYLGEYGSYSDVSTEDYTDHTLNAELFLDLDPKFNMDFQVGQTQGHEARGSSGADVTITTDPNEFEDTSVFAQLTYGRRTTTAQFQLEVDARELRFTNNNTDTDPADRQSSRDRDTTAVTGRFFYNLGPKTSAFLEVTQNDIDYVLASSSLDSTEQFVFVGARWDATAKTTGELKFGTYDKDFDTASVTDEDGTSVVANIVWSPRTYSHVTLAASNLPSETSTGDSFFTTSYYSLAWEHGFNDKVSVNANIGSGTDEYSGTRKDDVYNHGLGVAYKFQRWLDVGLNYTYSERDSNVDDADFEANSFMLSATLSLPE